MRESGATIVYTTHYMEEVEKLCDRVIILDKGKILASGTTDELKKKAKIEEKVTVEIRSFNPEAVQKIRELDNVDQVTYDGSILQVVYQKGRNNLADMIDYLKKEGADYSKIYSERPTLNDVFLELTGKELRD